MAIEKAKKTMQIWDQVCETDPKHVKDVSFGRKFKAVDAYYQIRLATEVFGPCGIGWKYTYKKEVTDSLIICELEFSYKLNDKWSEPIPVMSATPRYMKSKEDDDAYKKCVTDCLTKALSYLGFSADVFLGQFDDNKYVQQQRAKHQQKAPDKQADVNEQDEAPKTTGKGKDEPRTDKQRSMIWAKAMGLRNKNNQLAIALIESICENQGIESSNMTKTHASLVIKELQKMEELDA
jgi:uncharacterized short protein YbdD (DUF466 family)